MRYFAGKQTRKFRKKVLAIEYCFIFLAALKTAIKFLFIANKGIANTIYENDFSTSIVLKIETPKKERTYNILITNAEETIIIKIEEVNILPISNLSSICSDIYFNVEVSIPIQEIAVKSV